MCIDIGKMHPGWKKDCLQRLRNIRRQQQIGRCLPYEAAFIIKRIQKQMQQTRRAAREAKEAAS